MKKINEVAKAGLSGALGTKAFLVFTVLVISVLLQQASSVSSVPSDLSVGQTISGKVAYWTTPDIGTLEASANVLGGGAAELKYSNITAPTTTIDYGTYFHEVGFAPVSFRVRRNVTEPVFTDSCVIVKRNDTFNNTQYDETVCSKVQSGNIAVEKDIVLPVQQAIFGSFTYAYVTAESGETVKIDMPMLIGNRSVKYSALAKPTPENWLGSRKIEVDPQLNGVQYSNSSNFSIHINAPSSLSPMPPWMPIHSINITGIPEKNLNSSDVRIVETSTGNLVCFEIMSNTSSSIEIVPLVNFSSSNENKTFVVYWGNSDVGAFDNSCPNSLNWQFGSGKMLVPEASAGFEFFNTGIIRMNFSTISDMRTIQNSIFDDGVEKMGTSIAGTLTLVRDGKLVKTINASTSGGYSVLNHFYAFNNFTRFTFHGFTTTANDGFYGLWDSDSIITGANTIYLRQNNGAFGVRSGGSAAVDQCYGMCAGAHDSQAWKGFVVLNDSQQAHYSNGRDITSYTRSGDITDPQLYFPANAWGAANLKVWLGNFTVFLGPTGSSQADLNRTFERLNASWTWTWSSFVEGASAPSATETEGDNAIELGINNSIASATRYKTQKVYVVNASNNQWQGTVDYLVVQYNPPKRWLLNYITAGESYLNASNLSNTVYVLELTNKTSNQITNEVKSLLNATKS